MKRLFILLPLIPFVCFSQSNSNNAYPFILVDSPPLFSNCIGYDIDSQKECFESMLNQHIQDNIKFPESAFDSKIGGRVFVNFIINSKGRVSDILARGPDSSLEEEAERVLKLIPELKPAKVNGVNVDVSYSLPFDFYLLSESSTKEVFVKSGSNVYSNANIKSERIDVIKDKTLLNASRRGDYWQVELDNRYVGYIKNEDILLVNNNPNNQEVKENKEVEVEVTEEQVDAIVEEVEELEEELVEEVKQEKKENLEETLIDSKLNVEEAKQKLKQLTLLFNEDLISKELFEESSNKFKVIVELDEINKLKATKAPDISDTEALGRIKTLKSLYDQGFINRGIFEESVEILKNIIIDIRKID